MTWILLQMSRRIRHLKKIENRPAFVKVMNECIVAVFLTRCVQWKWTQHVATWLVEIRPSPVLLAHKNLLHWGPPSGLTSHWVIGSWLCLGVSESFVALCVVCETWYVNGSERRVCVNCCWIGWRCGSYSAVWGLLGHKWILYHIAISWYEMPRY